MIITNEDMELIEKLHGIAQRGWYADSMTVTNIYNRVFEKNERNTNCGSCIRRRIMELYSAKESMLKKLSEPQKDEGKPTDQPAENKPVEKPVEGKSGGKKTTGRKGMK